MNYLMNMAHKTLRLLNMRELSDFERDRQVNREFKLKERFNSIPYYANQACRACREGGDEAERKYWNDLYQIYLASTQGYTGSDFLVKLKRNK